MPPINGNLQNRAGEDIFSSMREEDPIKIPITHELDLHTFRPSEISDLLPEYFHECQIHGIFRVRVIHGKGTGTLREGVHRLLEKLPQVDSFQYPADAQTGSWGATWVILKPLETGRRG